MDTGKLKKFAADMRVRLLEGVHERLRYWGFDEKGNVVAEPEKVVGGYTFRGDVFSDERVPEMWKSMRRAVQRHSLKDVAEEGAYTWFNRLLCIRILEKNGYESPTLEYAPGTPEPVLLYNARQGLLPQAAEGERDEIQRLLADNKDDEAFRRLLVHYLHGQPVLKRVFGAVDDYTELLLPKGILDPGGLLDTLVHTDAITDDDYREVELIGWLYQFYIADRKDEVFASKGKVRPEDIPAATQIFTPRWIVRYLVENTIGRLWLDVHPDSPLRDEMEYLVVPDDYTPPGPDEPKAWDGADLHELTLLDPAVGSGHILVVAFDLLMEMYAEEGYTKRQATDLILKHNLYGIDIDDRAVQLARFALLVKAASFDRAVLSRSVLPNVHAMPEQDAFSSATVLDFLGPEGEQYADELGAALNEMQKGKSMGSALKLELDEEVHVYLQERLYSLHPDHNESLYEHALYYKFRQFIDVICILVNRYSAIATNPPYLDRNSMDRGLKEYIYGRYPHSKRDLFAVFMTVCEELIVKQGLWGMINQHSWMFLTSYEDLRRAVIKDSNICSMLHLGPLVFEELNSKKVQSTAFCVRSNSDEGYEGGTYYRLVDYRTATEKKRAFLEEKSKYVVADQKQFIGVPGSPVAYWLSSKMLSVFETHPQLQKIARPRKGMDTADNQRFLRYWYEVNKRNTGFNTSDSLEAQASGKKWFPINKGGPFRKWYGNLKHVVNWEHNGAEIKDYPKSYIRAEKYYFREGVTWTKIGSGYFSLRYVPPGCLFDSAGSTIFPNDEADVFAILGNLLSKAAYDLVQTLNPTLNFQVGDLKKMPVIGHYDVATRGRVTSLVKDNVHTTKADWDSRETSWDFARQPLVAQQQTDIRAAYGAWRNATSDAFVQLHDNEEELNRIFSALYGLQDELSSDVPLGSITVVQDELDSKGLAELEEESAILSSEQLKERLPFLPEVPVQQLISYAIGCILGRYRLDEPGLHIAHPSPSAEETAPYTVHSPLHKGKEGTPVTFSIDDDAILPLMGTDSPFSDDAVHQVQQFLRVVWGSETLTENLNYINEVLSVGASRGYVRPKHVTLEDYLVGDFWSDHVKTYQKRPIYWLFRSKKGAFQVLVYMHRIDKYTVQKVRYNYLHRYQQHLTREIAELEKDEATLDKQDAKRLDELRKQDAECRAYDAVLKEIADRQIEIDLDDGFEQNYPKYGKAVAKV